MKIKGNIISQPEKCTWFLGDTPKIALCEHKVMHMPLKWFRK